jgi:nucleoid-associated protein YgaU
VVQPGESFWSKAEQMRGGVSEAAVIDYWLALIHANRDRLVRPGDPDLILPGQSFVLPAPGP